MGQTWIGGYVQSYSEHLMASREREWAETCEVSRKGKMLTTAAVMNQSSIGNCQSCSIVNILFYTNLSLIA